MGKHKSRSQHRAAQSGSAVDHSHPTSVRVLELFFALFESDRGLRRAQIAALPHYEGMGEELFTVTFARDCEHLSQLGIRIIETLDFAGRTCYTVDADTVHTGEQMRLSAQQVILIHMALQACAVADDEALPILDLTLRASTDDPIHHPQQQAFVETTEALSSIMRAIGTQTPISFSYPSQTESTMRSLEPWKLLVKGHATYVWGYDLDRQSPRIFRLSRIEGQVEFLGEPGDCDHQAPQGAQAFDDFNLEPVLYVKQGTALPFADELRAVEGDSPAGWVRVQGNPETSVEWEHRVIDHALECVPVAPASFRHKLMELLEYASQGVSDA